MRLIDIEPLYCLGYTDGEHGTTFDDGVSWVLSKIDELPAVELQPEITRFVPKPPIWKEVDVFIEKRFVWISYCPTCNHEITMGQRYCSICGQHVDWSEEKI